MDNNGLIRVRSFGSVTRRDVMKGAAAMGVMAAAGLGATAASAKSTVSLFGWQGYDEGLRVGDFLAKNDIEVNFTPIGNNDEIVTRLASGGVGQMDLVTPYMGYVPLMVAAELLDPVDEALVPNLAKVPEVFRNDSNVVINGTRPGKSELPNTVSSRFTNGSGSVARAMTCRSTTSNGGGGTAT